MRSLIPAQVVGQPRAEAGTAAHLHRDCFACGHGRDSLGLKFDQSEAGGVSADWFCEQKYQSYPGIVHGGIIATILDCAMTNCLLMKGIAAVTAEMQIDYREPVRVGGTLTVRASLVRSRSPLFVLKAEVTQHGRVKASASAKFMAKDGWSDTSHV